jgi:hypothetical protein
MRARAVGAVALPRSDNGPQTVADDDRDGDPKGDDPPGDEGLTKRSPGTGHDYVNDDGYCRVCGVSGFDPHE